MSKYLVSNRGTGTSGSFKRGIGNEFFQPDCRGRSITATLRRPLACLFIAFLLFGCAAKNPNPIKEIRSKLGTIGVVSASFPPKTELQIFAKGPVDGVGKGIGIGATVTAVGLVYAQASCFVPPGPVICLGAIGAGAVWWGIKGWSMATPEAEAETIDQTLKESSVSLNAQERLRDAFLEVARKETRRKFVFLADEGPASNDQKMDYRPLAKKGVDTILEFRVQSLGWMAGAGEKPHLAFFILARTRLIRVSDGKEIHAYDAKFESPRPRRLPEWVDDGGGRLFSEEMERAYKELAEKIVEQLFLLNLDIGN